MAWRGQLSKNLKELRILLCQSSPSSAPARAFVEKNYKDLKSLNPRFPILIRECGGIEPQLWARYGNEKVKVKPKIHGAGGADRAMKKLYVNLGKYMGVERVARLEGLSEAQISKALEDLVKVGAS